MRRRVLLLDDHVAIRTGLQEILATAFPGLEFGAAEDFAAAMRVALQETWHLIIVDIDLAGGRSGLDFISSLAEAGSRTPTLVYTMHAEDQFGIVSLKAGASGYLSKAAAAEEIVQAVRALLSGERYISPTLGSLMAESLVRNAPEVPHDTLSLREFEVFRALAVGRPLVDIAVDLGLSPKTVSTYRRRVLEKLNLKSTSDLIRYAITNRLIR